MFFRCTIPILFREFEAAQRRAQDRHDSDVRLSWMTANLVRAKKIPDLDRLLGKTVKRPQQSAQAMVATMHALASAHGFKFTPGKQADGS